MSKSKILTVALIVCLAALAGCAWFMFGTTGAGISYANADKYTVGGTTVTDTVENLFIDWTEGKVNIEYHAGSGITVSETADRDLSEDDQLRWWLDGTTLRIRYAKPGFRISVSLHKQLTVSLPEGTVLKTAEIGSTSGDLNIPALAADEIRLDSTSGNVFAVTDTKKLTASATSGDIQIELPVGSACQLRFQTVSGTLEVDDIRTAEPGAPTFTIRTVSGDVSLHD